MGPPELQRSMSRESAHLTNMLMHVMVVANG